MPPIVFISLGPVEAIVIVVVVLVVFGAGRLAGVGKALGTGLREFREEARSDDPSEAGDGGSDGAMINSNRSDEDKPSSST